MRISFSSYTYLRVLESFQRRDRLGSNHTATECKLEPIRLVRVCMSIRPTSFINYVYLSYDPRQSAPCRPVAAASALGLSPCRALAFCLRPLHLPLTSRVDLHSETVDLINIRNGPTLNRCKSVPTSVGFKMSQSVAPTISETTITRSTKIIWGLRSYFPRNSFLIAINLISADSSSE